MHSRAILPLLWAASLLWGCALPKTVTTTTLLEEMTDLNGLAEFPNPPFTCKQFSSYDRRSQSPEQGEEWFANHDVGHFLRTEEREGRTEYVMMDADGPGAIVRIWSANPMGTLRIYLDGSQVPVLQVAMADLLGGRMEGIPAPIAGFRGRGWNCYFPIPYARHCLVTSDEGEFYYHINYRTYPPGTKVTTFQPEELVTLGSQIAAVAEQLAAPAPQDRAWTAHPSRKSARLTGDPGMSIPPGRTVPEAFLAKGPGAIVGMRVCVEAEDVARALRGLLLTIDLDGQRTVKCPLGDFFGGGPGLNPYTSLPVGVSADGTLWCNWVMPYRRSARVQMHNAGVEPVRVYLEVMTSDYTWTNRSMHFHAQWRLARDVATRPMHDWNYVDIRGQGVFVGTAFAIANPVKTWWGEGDEKIYVDGETFPSHFGTGTEDYFGYAWGSPELFEHAYHNQPRCDGPDNYGHTAVNRWHIIDRIPFKRDFRFDMEIWHWWDGVLPEISVVTYWYARPGATSNRMALAATDLRLTELPPYQPPRVEGALEGEELRIVHQTAEVGPQIIVACSNEQHLWWRHGRPGDRLVVAFPAPQAGRHHVLARFVKSCDYGIVALWINGQDTGQTIDLYSDQIVVTDEIPLGQFDLRAGTNYLMVEIVGSNEQAKPGHMFGLDYLRLEPLP